MKLNMQLQYFNGVTDVEVTKDNTVYGDWRTDIVPKFCKSHMPIAVKEAAGTFVAARFKEGGKRCADDVEAYTALVLDVDDGYSISKFQYDYKQYEYLLYTTFSHGSSQDKFRVIFPLKEEISVDEFIDAKNVCKSVFPFCDTASFVPSQGFYMPSCSTTMFDFARTSHNEGNVFDFDVIRHDVKIQKINRLMDQYKQMCSINSEKPRYVNRRTGADDTLERAQHYLDRTSLSLGYMDWIKVGMALKTIFGDDGFDTWHEFSKISDGYQSEEFTRYKWGTFAYDGIINEFGFFNKLAARKPRNEENKV